MSQPWSLIEQMKSGAAFERIKKKKSAIKLFRYVIWGMLITLALFMCDFSEVTLVFD